MSLTDSNSERIGAPSHYSFPQWDPVNPGKLKVQAWRVEPQTKNPIDCTKHKKAIHLKSSPPAVY